MIVNYNLAVITIVNYDNKTFTVQATGNPMFDFLRGATTFGKTALAIIVKMAANCVTIMTW